MAGNVYTVSQVTQYIKRMFTQDGFLRTVSITGEISNLKYHSSGHIYFSLKDGGAVIGGIMFAGQRGGLNFKMENGDKVVVTGQVTVYERDGRYQINATRITLAGLGALYERFLALKEELAQMGMFDQRYKKPIPAHVKRLGIITAPTGAAIQDIRNVSLRRNPFVQLILYPAQVQGEGAKESVARGLHLLDALGLDCIIVGRGGGSLEDLWAFNEELVARAIFECSTPVISAVGHETDVTIADLVADLRAPTPSAAAELAVENMRSTLDEMKSFQRRLSFGFEGRLVGYQHKLSKLSTRLSYLQPGAILNERRQTLADLGDDLRLAMEKKLTNARNTVSLYLERLEGLSPAKKLSQGYSYVADEEGRAITQTGQVEIGERVAIHVTDGVLMAIVDGKEKI